MSPESGAVIEEVEEFSTSAPETPPHPEGHDEPTRGGRSVKLLDPEFTLLRLTRMRRKRRYSKLISSCVAFNPGLISRREF